MPVTSVLRNLGGEGRLGGSILLAMVLLGFLIPAMSPHSAAVGGGNVLAPPSLTHPFGTDNLGRDVFTRTFAAAQLDLALALLGVAIPLLIGTIVGAVIGTTRTPAVSGLWEMVIEGINVFPLIVLAIAIVAMVGPGVPGLIVALSMTHWARYAKLARARALTLRGVEFVQVTEVLGYSRARVLLRHILPNVSAESVAYGISDFVLVIITVAGLSYLGLGVRPPAPEWGAMMADGRLFLQRQWWITVFPGLALSWTSVGVALLARDVTKWATGEE
ncbi:MAG: ABC transporter permease [Chloroflexota bacterium]|nr:MAG: ABC transporter permease [Chloroflexota bacterium]